MFLLFGQLLWLLLLLQQLLLLLLPFVLLQTQLL